MQPRSLVIFFSQRAGSSLSLIALVLSQACCASSSVKPAIGPVNPLTDRAAPDFISNDVVTGAVIATRAERKAVRVYFFGATWCGSCDRAWEQLDVLRGKYLARGLIVVGVAEASGRIDVERTCRLLETAIPIVNDTNMSIAGEWLVSALPSLFVVDRANTVRFVHTGYSDGDIVEVEREVEKLLGPR